MAGFIKLTTEWGSSTQTQDIWINARLIHSYYPGVKGSEVQVSALEHATVAFCGKIQVLETPDQIAQKLEHPELELRNKIPFSLYSKIDTTEWLNPDDIDFMRKISSAQYLIHLSGGDSREVKGIPTPVPTERVKPTGTSFLHLVR